MATTKIWNSVFPGRFQVHFLREVGLRVYVHGLTADEAAAFVRVANMVGAPLFPEGAGMMGDDDDGIKPLDGGECSVEQGNGCEKRTWRRFRDIHIHPHA